MHTANKIVLPIFLSHFFFVEKIFKMALSNHYNYFMLSKINYQKFFDLSFFLYCKDEIKIGKHKSTA